GRRVARVLAQSPQPVADVLKHRLEENRAVGLADLFLGLLDAAEPAERLGPCGRRRHPPADVLLGLALDVETDLLVEFFLHAASRKQGFEASEQACHGSSSV